MKKTGRNDPCPCGSGKKFKKCCEAKMIGGKFLATRVEAASAQQIQKTVNMTSFFQARLAGTPRKPTPSPSPLPETPAPETPVEGLPERPVEGAVLIEEVPVQKEENSPEKSPIC